MDFVILDNFDFLDAIGIFDVFDKPFLKKSRYTVLSDVDYEY